MKFTTPCFVRVENAEERKKLIKWLEAIGRRSEIYNEDDDYLFALTTDDENHNFTSFPDPLSGYYDCGTDVELFKALAAMNDENDSEQLFVNDLDMWFKADDGATEATFWTSDEYGEKHFALKATAAEIIEHFKNSQQ